MEKGTKKSGPRPDLAPVSLGELIHRWVRRAIETAVHEELEAALGAARYERQRERRGYRNGTSERTLTGPTGPLALTVPRATLHTPPGATEWRSALVPRYTRRLPEVNAAVVATYLAGGNQRRIRAALQPLLKAAPLSKSTVSRIVATLKDDLQAWTTRSLTELDVVYLYLDALVLRVRCDGQVEGVPVLTVVAVLADGQKQLLSLDLCSGESYEAWKGCLDDLGARGLKTPLRCIIDGNPGLRRAVGTLWPTAAVQRCCVHKLRNLERKAPKHALADLREDFHRIVYASSAEAARTTYEAVERTWAKRCPAVVKSLREGGAELLTFFTFPKAQWKTLRTTNVIERLNEEVRRRVKTQGALPTDDAAVTLLFSLQTSLFEPERDASSSTEAINLRSCYGVAAGRALFVFPRNLGHDRRGAARRLRAPQLRETRRTQSNRWRASVAASVCGISVDPISATRLRSPHSPILTAPRTGGRRHELSAVPA